MYIYILHIYICIYIYIYTNLLHAYTQTLSIYIYIYIYIQIHKAPKVPLTTGSPTWPHARAHAPDRGQGGLQECLPLLRAAHAAVAISATAVPGSCPRFLGRGQGRDRSGAPYTDIIDICNINHIYIYMDRYINFFIYLYIHIHMYLYIYKFIDTISHS